MCVDTGGGYIETQVTGWARPRYITPAAMEGRSKGGGASHVMFGGLWGFGF